ncbi:MAG: divalent-cation tolerance protein CutA [Thaumarchaeota archaeon]|nr:divalent-cation tolerance protein CutA [Nitrososphaerota archaeon]
MKSRILLCTYPSLEEARSAAKEAIGKKLAACVNIVKVNSLYTWKGKLEDADEFLAIYKTTVSKVIKLRNFIQSKHSYEVPEIVTLSPSDVSKKYLEWLVLSTK